MTPKNSGQKNERQLCVCVALEKAIDDFYANQELTIYRFSIYSSLFFIHIVKSQIEMVSWENEQKVIHYKGIKLSIVKFNH